MNRGEGVLVFSLIVAVFCFGTAGGAFMVRISDPRPAPAPQIIRMQAETFDVPKTEDRVPQEEPKKAPEQIKLYDPRCDTGARYDAMREAYDAGRPDPCSVSLPPPETAKPKKKTAPRKKKPNTHKSIEQLRRDWQRAEQSFPFIFQ